MRPHYVLCSVIALVSASEILAPARVRAADAKPAVLLVNGTRRQPGLADGDFEYFKRLNQHGFQLDVHFQLAIDPAIQLPRDPGSAP
jgi:hypothetical protein